MAAVRTFFFRMKAKNGTIMGNVLQNGSDARDAERKLLIKYPGATVLEVKER